jgi:3-dehydroquinate synthase
LGQELCLVIDSQVADLYLAEVENWLNKYPPKQHACFIFPAGENNKNLQVFQQLLEFLVANQFSRSLNLVALGGGVVGDLTGFVAACYLRGVNFVYCPTTLLAQIDASIGGKTGINLPEGKNLIGFFYPPTQVICDSHFLRSLPEREFISGLAEAVKHGMVCSESYFNWLNENVDAILSREPEILNYLLTESIRLKAKVVAQDFKDQGCRQWLNFGHTLGHALESATGYQCYLHGEAVAIGMVVAMKLSELQFGLSGDETKKLINLLTRIGLPVTIDATDLAAEKIMSYLKLDKKKRAGELHWVLLKKMAHPRLITAAFEESLKQVLLMLGAR